MRRGYKRSHLYNVMQFAYSSCKASPCIPHPRGNPHKAPPPPLTGRQYLLAATGNGGQLTPPLPSVSFARAAGMADAGSSSNNNGNGDVTGSSGGAKRARKLATTPAVPPEEATASSSKSKPVKKRAPAAKKAVIATAPSPAPPAEDAAPDVGAEAPPPQPRQAAANKKKTAAAAASGPASSASAAPSVSDLAAVTPPPAPPPLLPPRALPALLPAPPSDLPVYPTPVTVPLTKYEKIKVVGIRAEQLVRGMQPLVPVTDAATFDPCVVAEQELAAGVLPFIIKRTMPSGKVMCIRADGRPSAARTGESAWVQGA